MIDKREVLGYEVGTMGEEIFKSKSLYYEMKHNAEKYSKLQELSFADYVDTVKKYVRYGNYSYFMEDSIKWLGMGKVDRRKKYEEKESFNLLQKAINEDILNKDCVIKRISRLNLDTIAWIVEFQYFDKEFELYIPDMTKLSTKNFSSVHEGQLALGVKTEVGYDLFAFSYEESEIQKQFNDYVIDHPEFKGDKR